MPEREYGKRFSKKTKELVKQEQNNKCALCGMEGHLQIHHIIPRKFSGSNKRSNAVGLCDDGCHHYADIMILRNGIPFELLPKPIVVFEKELAYSA